MELREATVPCLSIGSLLAPVSWTMDVQSRHVPFSIPMRTHTGPPFRDSLCWSSNNVRFESFDGSGNTLHVTEMFAFRRDALGSYHGCFQKDEIGEFDFKGTYKPQDEAATLTRKQQPSFPQRLSGPPLQIWTVKITEGEAPGVREPQEKPISSPRFESMVAWLRSQNYEVFLHITLDAFDVPSKSATHAIERILQDAISKYRKPLIQTPNALLSAFSALDSGALCGKGRILATSDATMPCSCDPLATYKGPRHLFYASAIYTSAGKALLVLRRSRGYGGRHVREHVVWSAKHLTHPLGLDDAHLRRSPLPLVHGIETNDRSQDTRTFPKGRPVSEDLMDDKSEPDNEGSSQSMVAALRYLVSHKLKLNSNEDLYVDMHPEPRESAAGTEYGCDVDPHTAALSGEVMSLRAVCLATFPLTTDAASIYNYRSIEYAFEKHVERAIHEQCCGNQHGGSSYTDDIGEVELIKIHLSKRFVPSDDFLHFAQKRLKEERTYDNTTKERALADFQAALHLPVPPRSTLYGLSRKFVLCRGKYNKLHDGGLLPLQGEVQPEDNSRKRMNQQIFFVAQLIAPRLNSKHAIVLVAAVGMDTVLECSKAREGVAATTASQLLNQTFLHFYEEAAVQLSSTFFLEYPYLKRWTLFSTASDMAGFFFRQGYLLLHIPSRDSRYCDTTVRPNAAKCFTSLGSLIVHTSYISHYQKDHNNYDHAQAKHDCLFVSSAFDGGSAAASLVDNSASVGGTGVLGVPRIGACGSSVFKSLSAVWTLLSDSRTSDEFLDFYISEFYYHTGVTNINNVDKFIAAMEHGKAALTVRKKLTRSRATPSGLLNSREKKETIVWLDIGSDHRLYICVRECGVGRVLLIQASILLREHLQHGHIGDEITERMINECEETSLEAWVEDISAEAIGI